MYSFFIIQQGLHLGITKPIFKPVAIKEESEWHYRGQVIPDNKVDLVDFDVNEIVRNAKGVIVLGKARL